MAPGAVCVCPEEQLEIIYGYSRLPHGRKHEHTFEVRFASVERLFSSPVIIQLLDTPYLKHPHSRIWVFKGETEPDVPLALGAGGISEPILLLPPRFRDVSAMYSIEVSLFHLRMRHN